MEYIRSVFVAEARITMFARSWLAVASLAVLLVGCAPAAPAGRGESPASRAAAEPKRITAGIMGNPHTLYNKLNISNGVPGIDALQDLVGANLAIVDPDGQLRPWLAQEVPTIENGLWKLSPDGRMETTWKIKPNARWHDGAPFTAEDVLFSARLARDRELPQFRNPDYDLVEAIDAPDPYTVIVRWRQPYFAGDQPFDAPLPVHILQEASVTEKADFVNLPFWTEG